MCNTLHWQIKPFSWLSEAQASKLLWQNRTVSFLLLLLSWFIAKHSFSNKWCWNALSSVQYKMTRQRTKKQPISEHRVAAGLLSHVHATLQLHGKNDRMAEEKVEGGRATRVITAPLLSRRSLSFPMTWPFLMGCVTGRTIYILVGVGGTMEEGWGGGGGLMERLVHVKTSMLKG